MQKLTIDLTPQPPSLQGKGENEKSKPLSLQQRGFPNIVKSKEHLSKLILALTLLLAACNQSQSSSNFSATSNSNSILLGIAVAQTSNIALIGQEQVAGAKIAEEYFNQQGGIDGKPIKLVFQDAGGDEAGAINAFQTLITQNKVVGIAGPTTSQQGFGCLPIAERAKVPVITPSTIAKGIPEIGEYISRVSTSPDKVAPKSIFAVMKLHPQIKKVAIFYAQDQEAMVSETQVFQKTIKDLGLNIVTVQKFQIQDTDFQSQATAAINLKPDLAIVSGLPVDGGNLVKQLRELGYKGPIVGGNGFSTSNVFPVCKSFCNGIIVSQYYSPEQPNQINQVFRAAYRQKYQKEPPQFSAQAFTAVQVFVDALKTVNQKNEISKLSLTELRTELNKQLLIGKYETPVGQIAFTPQGDVIQKEFYVSEIKIDRDGKNGIYSFIK